MGKRYRQLGSEERELIAGMRHEDKGVSEIALALGRDKATVSRELQRNASAKYGCYKPCRAPMGARGSAGGVLSAPADSKTTPSDHS